MALLGPGTGHAAGVQSPARRLRRYAAAGRGIPGSGLTANFWSRRLPDLPRRRRPALRAHVHGAADGIPRVRISAARPRMRIGTRRHHRRSSSVLARSTATFPEAAMRHGASNNIRFGLAVFGAAVALAASPLAAQDARAFSGEELERGQRLYQAHCGRCHGVLGMGGEGPGLAVSRLPRAPDHAAVVDIIRDGIPGTGMPGLRATHPPLTRKPPWSPPTSSRSARRSSWRSPAIPSAAARSSRPRACASRATSSRGAGVGIGPELTGNRHAPGPGVSACLAGRSLGGTSGLPLGGAQRVRPVPAPAGRHPRRHRLRRHARQRGRVHRAAHHRNGFHRVAPQGRPGRARKALRAFPHARHGKPLGGGHRQPQSHTWPASEDEHDPVRCYSALKVPCPPGAPRPARNHPRTAGMRDHRSGMPGGPGGQRP